MMGKDGAEPRQLTDSPADHTPTVSPDGRYIVFLSRRSGKLAVWRVDMNGANPKQLTEEAGWQPLAVTPDGSWVVYSSAVNNLWKVPIEGGAPVRLTDKMGISPTLSPDGRLLAYYSIDVLAKHITKVAIIPAEGGEIVKTIDFAPSFSGARVLLRWSADGRSLIYVDARQGGANLWRLPLDGGEPQQLTNFGSEKVWYFDLSRDGRQFAVARGGTLSDVVMISEIE